MTRASGVSDQSAPASIAPRHRDRRRAHAARGARHLLAPVQRGRAGCRVAQRLSPHTRRPGTSFGSRGGFNLFGRVLRRVWRRSSPWSGREQLQGLGLEMRLLNSPYVLMPVLCRKANTIKTLQRAQPNGAAAERNPRPDRGGWWHPQKSRRVVHTATTRCRCYFAHLSLHGAGFCPLPSRLPQCTRLPRVLTRRGGGWAGGDCLHTTMF